MLLIAYRSLFFRNVASSSPFGAIQIVPNFSDVFLVGRVGSGKRADWRPRVSPPTFRSACFNFPQRCSGSMRLTGLRHRIRAAARAVKWLRALILCRAVESTMVSRLDPNHTSQPSARVAEVLLGSPGGRLPIQWMQPAV